MRRGRYYLGRIVKSGQLDNAKLVDAIFNPIIINANRYSWTITDTLKGKFDQTNFYYGRLSKYRVEGHVTVVDVEKKSQKDAVEPNLLEATSPFVYLPDHSGIAYLHVWNGIQEDVFRRRFKKLIEDKYQRIFCECDIDVIADYRTFSHIIESFERFTEISANVVPPNPLYGVFWKELRSYLEKRNVSEVQIKETEQNNEGIKTSLKKLISAITNNPKYIVQEPPAIGDAALLMAADGYGKGKVIGVKDGKKIAIRTIDTQKSFLLDKEPTPEELARTAWEILNDISLERRLKH